MWREKVEGLMKNYVVEGNKVIFVRWDVFEWESCY